MMIGDLDLAQLLPVLGEGGPWLVAVWLGYRLASRILADLCKTVPEVIAIGRILAEAADRASREGVTVHLGVDLDETTSDMESP